MKQGIFIYLLLSVKIFFKNGNAKVVAISLLDDIKVLSFIDESERIGSWDNEFLHFTFVNGESIPYKMFRALYYPKMAGDRKPRMKKIDRTAELLQIEVKVKSREGIRKIILVPLKVVNCDSGYIYFEPIKGSLKWRKCDLYGRIKRSSAIVKEPALISSELIAQFKLSIDNLCSFCLGAEPYYDCHICRKGRSGKINCNFF